MAETSVKSQILVGHAAEVLSRTTAHLELPCSPNDSEQGAHTQTIWTSPFGPGWGFWFLDASAFRTHKNAFLGLFGIRGSTAQVSFCYICVESCWFGFEILTEAQRYRASQEFERKAFRTSVSMDYGDPYKI